jgi:hypothetical protein
MELHITGEEIKFSPCSRSARVWRLALASRVACERGELEGGGYFTEYESTVQLCECFRSGRCHQVVVFDGTA